MINTRQFEDNFGMAQGVFANRIDAPDLSGSVAATVEPSLALFSTEKAGFRQVDGSPANLSRLVGKILLMPNGRENFSPVILSSAEGVMEITMLDLPFDPNVGLSDGLHFGLSAKAQTRVEEFGSHGGSGGFEAGHFSTVLAASSVRGGDIAQALQTSGDKATHVMLEKGTVETMATLGMVDIPYKTRRLPATLSQSLPIFWHKSLEAEGGVLAGDFPNATRLLLGAGVAAIGRNGLDRAGRLVESAVRGA